VDRKAFKSDQELDEKRLAFIMKSFPKASASDVHAYMRAWTTFGRRRVLHRLIAQNLESVEVSAGPIGASPDLSMVDMKVVVKVGRQDEP
jgi:hypothetical protein